MFVRIMKGDLKIQVIYCDCPNFMPKRAFQGNDEIHIFQAGAKHILDGVHPDAYEAFNSSRNIEAVVAKASLALVWGMKDIILVPN